MINSIIILNYNDYETTTKLLNNIISYESLNHIVIVDNCSTDGSYDELCRNWSGNEKIIILRSEKNNGYAAGNNLGLKYLKENTNTECVFISNPDVYFDESIIIKISNILREGEYSQLSGVMTQENGRVWNIPFETLPSFTTLILRCGFIGRRILRLFFRNEIDFSKQIIDVDVVLGSFFGMKLDTFEIIDYFDENTFLYFEEWILAKKLKCMGLKSGIVTTEKYIHYESVSISKSLKKVKSYSIQQQSFKYFVEKYMNLNCWEKIVFNVAVKFDEIEKRVIIFLCEVFVKIKERVR